MDSLSIVSEIKEFDGIDIQHHVHVLKLEAVAFQCHSLYYNDRLKSMGNNLVFSLEPNDLPDYSNWASPHDNRTCKFDFVAFQVLNYSTAQLWNRIDTNEFSKWA